MAFTAAQRVQIERYMGWPPPNVEPKYQAFVTTLQAVTEGGSMTDNAREVYIAGLLVELELIQVQLRGHRPQMLAGGVGTLRVDAVRGAAGIRQEGRRLVHNLSRALNHTPLADAFAGPSTVPVE